MSLTLGMWLKYSIYRQRRQGLAKLRRSIQGIVRKRAKEAI